jgi:hypothetical protein
VGAYTGAGDSTAANMGNLRRLAGAWWLAPAVDMTSTDARCWH